MSINLVPRACDPREGTRGSGIILFREESDWPLKWMRSSILARIPGFRQRIIPEPRVPSRGSQARGTRLSVDLFDYLQKIFNVLLRSQKVFSTIFFHSSLLLASINLTCNFNNFVRQITLSVIITLFQGLELIVQLS